MIRIVENNDWVVFCILGSIFVFIIILLILNRESSIKDFLTQKTDESNNLTLTWLLITFVRSLIISVVLSKFITVIPDFISNIQLYGYQLNNFGFTFLAFLAFEFSRNLLTIIFYASTGSNQSTKHLILIASKYYFIETIIFMIVAFVEYFYPSSKFNSFYIITILVFTTFLLKNIIYIFNKQSVLPEKWYYKFLYICTLQIVPILVLWKLLFF